jgi:hypothetical protein
MTDESSYVDSPGLAMGVPLMTSAAGAAISLADVNNWMTTASLAVGLITSLVLLVNHIRKGRILAREWDNLVKESAKTLPGAQDP